MLTAWADLDAPEVTGGTMADAVTLAGFYLGEAARLSDAATVSAEVERAEALRAVPEARRGTMIGSCGCFGREETPPHPSHVVLNLVLAAVASPHATAHDAAQQAHRCRRCASSTPWPR